MRSRIWWRTATKLLSLPLFAFALTASNLVASQIPAEAEPGTSTAQQDWLAYGGGPLNDHYSSLDQINRSNVQKLTVAWSFDSQEPGGLQTSPIIVDGILYGLTPTQRVFALDAATGALVWKFDSGITGTQPDRGLA